MFYRIISLIRVSLKGEGEGEGVFVLSALILATRPDPLGYLREHAGSGVLS